MGIAPSPCFRMMCSTGSGSGPMTSTSDCSRSTDRQTARTCRWTRTQVRRAAWLCASPAPVTGGVLRKEYETRRISNLVPCVCLYSRAGILYVVVPLFVWNFSPHALTHTTPVFLLGATDWGSGNIYTFTKIAYWMALFSECLRTPRQSRKNRNRPDRFCRNAA